MANSSRDDVRDRLEDVRARIEQAAKRAGRSGKDITLIAIGKTHPAETLKNAVAAGVSNLGENRVQEAETKILELGRHAVRWHLVGHLQPNKARRVVRLFDVIHSLDSDSLALRLDRICLEENVQELGVLVQIDLGQEATKTGVTQEDLPTLLETLRRCPRLRFEGLMTLPPYFEDPERVRPYFRLLRELRDQLRERGYFSSSGELSMGMTHDFEVAIEEGATMVRIGTAIFGDRSKNNDEGE